MSSEAASASALRRVVATFLQGSVERAALALVSEGDIDPAEREALEAAIARARAEGR